MSARHLIKVRGDTQACCYSEGQVMNFVAITFLTLVAEEA